MTWQGVSAHHPLLGAGLKMRHSQGVLSFFGTSTQCLQVYVLQSGRFIRIQRRLVDIATKDRLIRDDEFLYPIVSVRLLGLCGHNISGKNEYAAKKNRQSYPPT
jgi:hypothetical protein